MTNFSEKNTKIVIYVLQQNLDDESRQTIKFLNQVELF